MRHNKSLDVSLGKNLLITFIAFIAIFIFGGVISGFGDSKSNNNSNPTFSPPSVETIGDQKVIVPTATKVTIVPKIKPKVPSQYASFLASYVVFNSNKEDRDKLVKMLDKDTNSLVTAERNLALEMDRNPELLKEVEIRVFQNISNNVSRNSGTTLDDLESKLSNIESDLNDIKSNLEP